MIKRLFLLILITSALLLNAQEKCGTKVITKQMMENNPDYALARAKVNDETEKWIKNHPNHSENTIITIPVIVHIVHRTQDAIGSNTNISNVQIQSQIDVLNQDYRRTNLDAINPNGQVWWGIAADCEIEFCLATTDPNGQPTTGIERTPTTHGQFGMGNDIHSSSAGGADDWPNDDYLNIWVCDIQNGLLGYAIPPSSSIGDGDGVVVGYTNFGLTSDTQYGKGRTATHEVGHWLNLEHLWGDSNCGNDHVLDTPKQETDNYWCPGYPHNANSCNTINPDGDMFMNYMDYTNDACMNLFTEGQKTRMLAAINQFRPNMLSHNLCDGATSVLEMDVTKKELVKIINILGKETTKQNPNTPLFYIYDDGSVEKKIVIE